MSFFEKMKIELVDTAEEPDSSNANPSTIEDRFQYYFSFKNIDIKKFDKNRALPAIRDHLGDEITSMPITYENLTAEFSPFALPKDEHGNNLLKESKVMNSELLWGVNRDETRLRTQFFGDIVRPISQAMADHAFYVELSKYSYKTQLGFDEETTESDFDVILHELGNPNELYIHSEINPKSEEADYWLVYNYGTYILAFNFTESSTSASADTARPPEFVEGFYIDGNSFEEGINGVKGRIFDDYYKSMIDLVVK